MATRGEVETMNTEEMLKSLKRINSSRDNALQFCGGVDIGVHGYDDDDRELFEIPEVCKYFNRLTKQFPYFFFFMDLNLPTLKVIAFCLSEARSVGNGRVELNNLRLGQFMMGQYTGLNEIFHQHGLDKDYPNLNQEISEEVERYFQS